MWSLFAIVVEFWSGVVVASRCCLHTARPRGWLSDGVGSWGLVKYWSRGFSHGSHDVGRCHGVSRCVKLSGELDFPYLRWLLLRWCPPPKSDWITCWLSKSCGVIKASMAFLLVESWNLLWVVVFTWTWSLVSPSRWFWTIKIDDRANWWSP